MSQQTTLSTFPNAKLRPHATKLDGVYENILMISSYSMPDPILNWRHSNKLTNKRSWRQTRQTKWTVDLPKSEPFAMRWCAVRKERWWRRWHLRLRIHSRTFVHHDLKIRGWQIFYPSKSSILSSNVGSSCRTDETKVNCLAWWRRQM